MTRLALVAGGLLDGLPRDFDGYIGVDAGCLAIMAAELPLLLAAGDFDSVTAEERQAIKAYAQRFLPAPAEKDDTDLELALRQALRDWPQAELTVYGALGGRLDHSLSAVFLPSHPDLAPCLQRFRLADRQNLVLFYPVGRHRIPPRDGYAYLSFLQEGQGELRISGARYELTAANYFSRKIYSSNEFLDGPVSLEVPDGYAAVIYSKDR